MISQRLKPCLKPFGIWLGSFEHHHPQPIDWPKPTPQPIPDPVKNIQKNVVKVSVVVPSFNQGHFIGQTIDSLLQQDHPNIQVIVQDAGSTDATRDVLAQYGNAIEVHTEADDGQADGINRGMRRADGDLLAWLNSDDLLMPGAIAAAVQHFQTNPETDVVYGHRLIVNEKTQAVGRWVLPPDRPRARRWRCHVPQETMVWRRTIWDKVGSQLNPEFRFAMDWDLVLRFEQAGARFHRLPRFQGIFRTHPEQKSLSWREQVGEKEFFNLRATHFQSRRKQQMEQTASMLHLFHSAIYTWAWRVGVLNAQDPLKQSRQPSPQKARTN